MSEIKAPSKMGNDEITVQPVETNHGEFKERWWESRRGFANMLEVDGGMCIKTGVVGLAGIGGMAVLGVAAPAAIGAFAVTMMAAGFASKILGKVMNSSLDNADLKAENQKLKQKVSSPAP